MAVASVLLSARIRVKFFRAALLAALLSIGALSVLYSIQVVRTPDGGPFNALGASLGGDFIVFYVAGHEAFSDRFPELYNPPYFHEMQRQLIGDHGVGMAYAYPPLTSLFWMPVTFLSFKYAYWAWIVVMAIGLVWTLGRFGTPWWIILLIMISPLVTKSLVSGQTGPLFTIILGTGLLLLPRRPVLAGAILALLAFKPHLSLLVPLCLLATSNWRALGGLVAGGLAFLVIPVLIHGPDVWIAFLDSVTSHSSGFFSAANPLWDRSPTVFKGTLQVTGSVAIAAQVHVGVAVLACLALVAVWRRSQLLEWRVLALTVAMLLVTPKAIYVDATPLILPMALMATHWRRGHALPLLALMLVFWGFPLVQNLANAIDFQPSAILLMAALAWVTFQPNPVEGDAVARAGPG